MKRTFYKKRVSKYGGVSQIVKVVQVGRAVRAGVSALGTKYRKNEVVLHLSSHRATREVYVLTWHDITEVQYRMADGQRFRKISDVRREPDKVLKATKAANLKRSMLIIDGAHVVSKSVQGEVMKLTGAP